MTDLRKRIFSIIQIGYKEDIPSRVFDYFIVIMILLNLFTTIAETFSSLSHLSGLFDAVDVITVVIFTIEYALRLWTADYLYPDRSKGRAILAFVFSFYGIIDLLAFLPFYLPFFFPAGAVAFRMFRVFRIFRLFKVNSQYDAFNVILDVINEKRTQLISSIVFIFIFLIASSLCMYSFEHEAQPEVFKNAFSGMWWAVSALLTVGYGDIYPITTWGQIFAIIIAFLGVLMVAVPTGIISAGFVEVYTKAGKEKELECEPTVSMEDVSKGHRWLGREVGEIPLPPDRKLLLILRHGESILPSPETVIEDGDRIVIVVDK